MLCTRTPPPPYYAVVFTATRARQNGEMLDAAGYTAMAAEMVSLAEKQDGFLGIDSAKEAMNITVSYWRDLESIKQWKENLAHREAQKLGREKWYSAYRIRICKVEREYGTDKSKDTATGVPG